MEVGREGGGRNNDMSTRKEKTVEKQIAKERKKMILGRWGASSDKRRRLIRRNRPP